MAKIPHDPNELLAVVTIMTCNWQASRKDIHAAGKLHRHASVLITTAKGRYWLQRRKDKESSIILHPAHFLTMWLS